MIEQSQGRINGVVTRLANNPEALKEYMKDKTESQKRLARVHLLMVRSLRK